LDPDVICFILAAAFFTFFMTYDAAWWDRGVCFILGMMLQLLPVGWESMSSDFEAVYMQSWRVVPPNSAVTSARVE
jgi:hypothetical protein